MTTPENRSEESTLRHAAAWLRYQNSQQYRTDLLVEQAQRAKRDRALGHVPACSLTRCADQCQRKTL